jgi:hypothetical protein
MDKIVEYSKSSMDELNKTVEEFHLKLGLELTNCPFYLGDPLECSPPWFPKKIRN